MKIALIGTHGTGKTTIAHELVAELKKNNFNAEFLGEVARQCPLQINEETTKKAQEWIIYSQYIKEIENETKNGILVCDRSVLDGYVYYYNKFSREGILERFVREKIKDYDFLFRVPLNQNYLIEDGKRSIDKGFQIGIDKIFTELLDRFSIDYYREKDTHKIVERIKNA